MWVHRVMTVDGMTHDFKGEYEQDMAGEIFILRDAKRRVVFSATFAHFAWYRVYFDVAAAMAAPVGPVVAPAAPDPNASTERENWVKPWWRL